MTCEVAPPFLQPLGLHTAGGLTCFRRENCFGGGREAKAFGDVKGIDARVRRPHHLSTGRNGFGLQDWPVFDPAEIPRLTLLVLNSAMDLVSLSISQMATERNESAARTIYRSMNLPLISEHPDTKQGPTQDLERVIGIKAMRVSTHGGPPKTEAPR